VAFAGEEVSALREGERSLVRCVGKKDGGFRDMFNEVHLAPMSEYGKEPSLVWFWKICIVQFN